MRRLLIYSGPVILLIANIFVFSGVAWNRNGTPTSEIAFSQCEFNWLTNFNRRPGQVRKLYFRPQSTTLDPDLLEDFQFPREIVKGTRYFAKPAWVVIEHDGDAWQAYLEKNRDRKYFTAPKLRLIIVDAGRDAKRLREKYPDQSKFIIVRGVAERRVRSDYVVVRVLDTTLSVTSEFRSKTTAIKQTASEQRKDARANHRKSPACEPTHHVIVKWGQRYEPWLHDVTPLPSG